MLIIYHKTIIQKHQYLLFYLYIAMILTVIILVIIVCAFEFVNGFHDTANAVATVIYTETLKPKHAVIYSAFMNFLGMLITTSIGYGVAQKIFQLIPWSNIQSNNIDGIIVITSAMITALARNLLTWWRKIPSSSTHGLIASLVWASTALLYTQWVNTTIITPELRNIILSLVISPLLGAIWWYLLYRISKAVINDKSIFHKPHHHHESKWMSALLISTCGFVSFTHWSNDGQKWLGMLMAVLIVTGSIPLIPWSNSMPAIPLRGIILIPTVLWIGTMIWWRRIVKTIGTKIGTHEMTYAQGAAAELVAASTIGLASYSWLPVSTTHVLSSAVMGTMAQKNIKDSINWDTVRHIALARILTVPICATIAFSSVLIIHQLFTH